MEKDYNLYENTCKGYESSPPFRTESSFPLDPAKINAFNVNSFLKNERWEFGCGRYKLC
jgi:hypothetical protein